VPHFHQRIGADRRPGARVLPEAKEILGQPVYRRVWTCPRRRYGERLPSLARHPSHLDDIIAKETEVRLVPARHSHEPPLTLARAGIDVVQDVA